MSGSLSARYVSNDMLRDHIFLLEQPRHRSLAASQRSTCQRAHVPIAAAREDWGPSASKCGADRSAPNGSALRRQVLLHLEGQASDQLRDGTVCLASPRLAGRIAPVLGVGSGLLAAHCQTGFVSRAAWYHIAAWFRFQAPLQDVVLDA
jgi:hypothetical protein